MIVQTVMFKSGLSDEEVRQRFEDRAPQYRAVLGLLPKLYIEDKETGEYGGIYVWKDEESLEASAAPSSRRRSPRPTRSKGKPDGRPSRSSAHCVRTWVSSRPPDRRPAPSSP